MQHGWSPVWTGTRRFTVLKLADESLHFVKAENLPGL